MLPWGPGLRLKALSSPEVGWACPKAVEGHCQPDPIRAGRDDQLSLHAPPGPVFCALSPPLSNFPAFQGELSKQYPSGFPREGCFPLSFGVFTGQLRTENRQYHMLDKSATSHPSSPGPGIPNETTHSCEIGLRVTVMEISL